MRTIGGDFFSFLSEKTVSQQVENDIRIITKKSKKRNKAATEVQTVTPEVKDSYEQAMDTSKYDKILSELTI
ncbi:MAG: hypothetical protein NC218_09200 [Acetobacter sp.]|nr:hypothetical protein [Acetobacter sp.]